jgi:mercuric ion binding protein
VKAAMGRVPGVTHVTVDLSTKVATVNYDPARATPVAIAAASTKVGYPARIATR